MASGNGQGRGTPSGDPYGYEGINEAGFDLSEAVNIGVYCIAGTQTPEDRVMEATRFGVVNCAGSKAVVMSTAPDHDLSGEPTTKVLYTLIPNERLPEIVLFVTGGFRCQLIPVGEVYLEPRMVSFLFGTNPDRHYVFFPEITDRAITHEQLNEWKVDAGELITNDWEKARGNIFHALAGYSSPEDRLNETDEMLKMIRDIYLTGQVANANAREKFLLRKMMFLCNRVHRWCQPRRA